MLKKFWKFFEAFQSIFIGMGITFKYLTSKAVTFQYPDQKRPISLRWRGLLALKGFMGETPHQLLRESGAEPQTYKAYVHKRLKEDTLPHCTGACPANVDVSGQNALVAEGKYLEAFEIVQERNILPGVLGRICHHPCEGRCRRGYYDEPVSIKFLHRFIAEEARKTRRKNNPKLKRELKKREEKVAIIGSGPSGLAAAFDLAKEGYQVTIFEKQKFPGGMLAIGVPLYRLPRDVLLFDIERVKGLGVEIRTGVEVGKDLTIKDLKKQGFKAILIAVGLQVSRSLPIPGIDLDGVLLAVPFLKAVNSGEKVKIGKDVIVIGGGNVAVDVARCARRVGAEKVKMVCLEARHEMPAFPWEIEESLEEGIEIHCSWGPKQILGKDGRVVGLEVKECTAVFDAQGRFAPTFCEEHTKVVEGDTVILAIGQASDLSLVEGTEIKLNERRQLIFDKVTLETTETGVFACGEVTTGPSTAIGSIATGHEAAISISRFLRGEDLRKGRLPAINLEEFEEYPQVDLEDIEEERLRPRPVKLSVEERIDNFKEIELGFKEKVAVKEALRCLRCYSEKCVGCTFCARTCPDFCIEVERTRDGKRVAKYQIEMGKCMFCGLCSEQCPTRSLVMTPQHELAFYQKELLEYDKEKLLRSEKGYAFKEKEKERKYA